MSLAATKHKLQREKRFKTNHSAGKKVLVSCLFIVLTGIYIDYVDLTKGDDGAKSQFWIEELNLHPTDQQCFTNGDWLNDAIITAGLTLLKQAFPQMGGLQDTILAETLSFEVSRSEFVQVKSL